MVDMNRANRDPGNPWHFWKVFRETFEIFPVWTLINVYCLLLNNENTISSVSTVTDGFLEFKFSKEMLNGIEIKTLIVWGDEDEVSS